MKKITNKQLSEVYKKATLKDGFFNLFFYRKISIQVTRILAILNFSPNSVTLMSFVFTLMAAVFFVFGDYNLSLYGVIPLNVGRILDSTDGEIAILENKKTKLGAFLDLFLDRASEALIFFALAYGYFRHTGNNIILVIYAFLVLIYFLSYYQNLYAKDHNVDYGKQVVGKTSRFIPQAVRRYIRWDGGFSTILISIFIIMYQIPVLLLIYLFLELIPACFSFMNLIHVLRKEN